MNELVQLIVQKTGLPQDKAQEVVDTVVTHLKAKLPDSVTTHLNALLANSGSAEGLVEEAKSAVAGISSMLGNKTA